MGARHIAMYSNNREDCWHTEEVQENKGEQARPADALFGQAKLVWATQPKPTRSEASS